MLGQNILKKYTWIVLINVLSLQSKSAAVVYRILLLKNKVATSTSRKLEMLIFLEYKKNIFK